MNCDWRDLTWWEYSARLHAWNEAHDTDTPKAPVADVERVRRLMTMH
jgi:hypothetical protein